MKVIKRELDREATLENKLPFFQRAGLSKPPNFRCLLPNRSISNLMTPILGTWGLLKKITLLGFPRNLVLPLPLTNLCDIGQLAKRLRATNGSSLKWGLNFSSRSDVPWLWLLIYFQGDTSPKGLLSQHSTNRIWSLYLMYKQI